MMKIAVVALVVAVAAAMAVAVKDATVVQFQRCQNSDCSGTCTTVMEQQLYKCLPGDRGFDRSRMLRQMPISTKRSCFTETIYNTSTCGGTVVSRRARECNDCLQQEHGDPFKFSQVKCSTNASVPSTLRMDCDENCGNCGQEFPISFGSCMTPPFPDPRFKISIMNSALSSCGGSGWTEGREYNFFMPNCDGQPNRERTFYGNVCEIHFGQAGKVVFA